MLSGSLFPNVLFNLPYLLIGVILLCWPRGGMRWGIGKPRSRSDKERASAEEHWDHLLGDQSFWLGEELTERRNWLDLLRGWSGGYAVVVAGITVGGEGTVEAAARLKELGLEGAILLVAVLVQTLRFEGKLAFHPSIFFLGGLAFSIVGWQGFVFAFAGVGATNLVLPTAAVFLFCYAGVLLISGVFFGTALPQAGFGAGLALVPVLGALMTGRRLMAQFGRKAKSLGR